MDTTTPSQAERAEMESVLQSGIFGKAPRLGNFFRYICERYLEGNGDQVKEYSIALEALGRSAEFDPKKDSIVRVEAHRLRKRLEEYYAGAGADHPIQIRIPSGGYCPQFLQVPAIEASALTADTVDIVELARQVSPRPVHRRRGAVMVRLPTEIQSSADITDGSLDRDLHRARALRIPNGSRVSRLPVR
jgi:hypothetical protein